MGLIKDTLLSLLGEKTPGRVEIVQHKSPSNEKTRKSDNNIDGSYIFLAAPDIKNKGDQHNDSVTPESTGKSLDSKRDILLKKESSLKEDTISKDGVKPNEKTVVDQAAIASENEKLHQDVVNNNQDKDCLGCKITSTLTCFGAGSYIASKAWNVPQQYVHKAFAFRGFVLSFASVFFLLGTGALFDVKMFDTEDFKKDLSYTEYVKTDIEKMKTLGNKIRNMDIKMNTANQPKP